MLGPYYSLSFIFGSPHIINIRLIKLNQYRDNGTLAISLFYKVGQKNAQLLFLNKLCYNVC